MIGLKQCILITLDILTTCLLRFAEQKTTIVHCIDKKEMCE